MADERDDGVRRTDTVGADGVRRITVQAGDIAAGETVVGVNLDDLGGHTGSIQAHVEVGDVGPGATVIGASLSDTGAGRFLDQPAAGSSRPDWAKDGDKAKKKFGLFRRGKSGERSQD